ncbi:MAG: hypothetical protein WBM78_10360 [Desulfobacterales bacterium]
MKIPYFNLPRIEAPSALHHVVTQGIERKAIFKDDTDREDFIERLSKLLQEMDADAIGRYRSVLGHRRCVPLSWHQREGASPANSRAARRVSHDPELPAATKTIQRELENNQH